jgi:hypothetical protein
MKAKSDAERFRKYRTIIHALLERPSFHKKDLYSDLDGDKKAFIFVPRRGETLRRSQVVISATLSFLKANRERFSFSGINHLNNVKIGA